MEPPPTSPPEVQQQRQAAKEEGNRHFAAHRYAESIDAYTRGIGPQPDAAAAADDAGVLHLLYSNRAAARLKAAEQLLRSGEPGQAESSSRQSSNDAVTAQLRRAIATATCPHAVAMLRHVEGAAQDAQSCVTLAPGFRRGWVRLATARLALGQRQRMAGLQAALQAATIDLGLLSKPRLTPRVKGGDPGLSNAGAATTAAESATVAGTAAAAALAPSLDDPAAMQQQLLVEPSSALGLVVDTMVQAAAEVGCPGSGRGGSPFNPPSPDDAVGEITCPQCLAVLHCGVTLGDGQTVCQPCVPKWRKRCVGRF
jgi:hypothetical protein